MNDNYYYYLNHEINIFIPITQHILEKIKCYIKQVNLTLTMYSEIL